MRITGAILGLALAGSPSARADGTGAHGAAPAGEPVLMPTFRVTDNFRALDEAVDAWDRKLDADRFTWRDGGTYMKFEGPRFTTELRFRFSPQDHGIELLRISW